MAGRSLEGVAADIVRGAHFRAVDAAPAPHSLLATFDAVAAREGVRRLEQRGLDLLAVAAGQRLLDIGCGAGHDIRALAHVIGPGGLVVGVEPSTVLLAEALPNPARRHGHGLSTSA